MWSAVLDGVKEDESILGLLAFNFSTQAKWMVYVTFYKTLAMFVCHL